MMVVVVVVMVVAGGGRDELSEALTMTDGGEDVV